MQEKKMITEKQIEFGSILEHVADELDIPDSKYEEVVQKYEAVCDWLGKDDSQLSSYSPRMFAQGSFSLGTCVKPFKRDEYDIDFVCKLELPSSVDQRVIYDLVGKRLKEHKTYNEMIQPKNRCWRLKYAGSFHMDILPAIPDDQRNDESLLVPDKELSEWKESNPEGYAKWFYRQMEAQRQRILKAVVDPVPKWKIKTPLQRSVQILKRHRDIVFQNEERDKPPSIIITTLAAKAYGNEGYLFEALINIIDNMRFCFDNDGSGLAVLNPTNEGENFAEKWTAYPKRKEKFLEWLINLRTNLFRMLELKGLPQISKSLEPLFEQSIVHGAIEKYAEKYQSLREQDKLKINPSTGFIGATGSAIKRNTFYGD